MSSQQLLLSWKDHNGALISVFENLLKRNTLVDCTLAAEGHYLKAHKVVLSACSSYFEMLFSQESDKNPIVILKDVKFQELEAAVNFMYRGEVEVCEDRLAAFLEVADSLQIKGLGSNGKTPDTKSKTDPVNNSKTSVVPRQQPKKNIFNTRGDNSNGNSNLPVETEQVISTEHLSLHRPSQSENSCSPHPVSSSCSIPSSCLVRQETPNDRNSVDKCSSPPVSNVLSSESVPSEVNAVVKTEPIAEVFLDDKSDDEFVDDVTMMDDEDDEWCKQNAKSMGDEHSTNRPDLVYGSNDMKTEESTSNNIGGAQAVEHSSSGGAESAARGSLQAAARSRLLVRYITPDPASTDEEQDAAIALSTAVPSQPAGILQCPHCDFAAGRLIDLKIHWREHAHEKPYKCSQCKYTSTRRGNLLRHRQVHVKEKLVYPCTECNLCYKSSSSMKTHRRMAHRI